MKKNLIIAAHPDDEILGCGATMLRKIEAGEQVYSVVLGEGITSRYEKRELAPKEELKELNNCLKKVAKHMGFEKSWHFDLPDNRFDSVDLLDIIKKIESVIEEVKPDSIYTHHSGDLNIDHRITFQAVMTACRPFAKNLIKEIYTFEIPSSTESADPFNDHFSPNTFVEVSSYLDKKIEAMNLYVSETTTYPNPRSAKALEIIAQRWGTASGLNAAEAFMLIRKVNP